MSSDEADETYRKLLKLYEEAGYVNPKAVLNDDINELTKKGKTRDEAILHLNEHPEDREISESERKEEKERLESQTKEKLKEAKDQQIAVEQVKKKIADLTVLFSKNEISEEAYKTAVRTLEKSVGGLKSREETPLPSSGALPRGPPREEEISMEGLTLGEGIIIFLFSPIAGIIAWLIWHEDKPEKANETVTILVIALIVEALLVCYILSLFHRI
jgi:hypothetical protein